MVTTRNTVGMTATLALAGALLLGACTTPSEPTAESTVLPTAGSTGPSGEIESSSVPGTAATQGDVTETTAEDAETADPAPTDAGAPPSATGDASEIGPLGSVALTVAEGVDPGSAEGRSLNVPDGWSAQVWADIGEARLAAWTPDGRLLVSTGDRGSIEMLTPTGHTTAPTIDTLLGDLSGPQGLAFADTDGGSVLVVGDRDRIVVWDYADGSVSNERVLVDGLPTSGHGGKAVAVHDEIVYYSLGSASNRDPADRAEDPERATVWQVGLDGSGNAVVATGVRNGFGLDIAPDGTLFVAVNQADNQPYPFRDDTDQYGEVVPEFVNENPIEQVSRLTPGTDLGWPYCVPDTRNRPDTLDLPFVDDPLTNADGSALDCATLPPTMLGLPAHSAPLGLAFTAGHALEPVIGTGALLTSHGSWNRQPPRPPSVVFSPWDAATATLGVPVDLVTGFQDEDGSRWGRAVTAIAGPDGSLYVTDDDAGLVYRLTPG